jgi:hypothetical protein
MKFAIIKVADLKLSVQGGQWYWAFHLSKSSLLDGVDKDKRRRLDKRHSCVKLYRFVSYENFIF